MQISWRYTLGQEQYHVMLSTTLLGFWDRREHQHFSRAEKIAQHRACYSKDKRLVASHGANCPIARWHIAPPLA
jgi:hypothetical protein